MYHGKNKHILKANKSKSKLRNKTYFKFMSQRANLSNVKLVLQIDTIKVPK